MKDNLPYWYFKFVVFGFFAEIDNHILVLNVGKVLSE